MKKFEKKTVYIYEINGQEKVTITSAEEASRWDAIFATAERLDTLMQKAPPEVKLDENQRTDLCIYLAQQREAILEALYAEEPPAEARAGDQNAERKESPSQSDEEKKASGMKKQSFVQEFKRPVPPSKDGFSL